MKATPPDWDSVPEILKTKDLAKILLVTVGTINNRLRASKNLPPFTPTPKGSPTLWKKPDVIAWYESLEA